MSELKKTIWITGASSGIGEELAVQWAGHFTRLVLSGRNRQQLERVSNACEKQGAEVLVVPFDLTVSEQIKDAVELVKNKVERIDILVNNGGITQRSLLIDTSEVVTRRIMETDFWGHVSLTRQILPFMIEKGGGSIAIVSSLAGLFGFPQRSGYCAAKHALHGYFETLRLEHWRDNIHVTLICPGRIRTNISYHALRSDGSEHGVMDPGQFHGVSVERCARKIIKAVNRHRKQLIIGQLDSVMPFLKRYFPWLFYKIATRIDATA